MLNQIIIVGRLIDDIKMTNVDGKNVSYITVAVPRSFKNANGEYDTDFIECVLYNTLAENTIEYCKKGDVIGVKGRIQTTNVDDGDGHYTKKTLIIAEKITFLSSRNNNA